MRKLILLILGIAVIGLVACSSAVNSETQESPAISEAPAAVATDNSYLMRSAVVASDDFYIAESAVSGADSPSQVRHDDIAETGQRHVIQTAEAFLESENFDQVVADLRQLAPSVNGYVEADMLTTQGMRMFTIVLRVPAGTFEDVLDQIVNLADMRHMNQWAEDVTDLFYDMRSSLSVRRIEEERVLNLIDAATEIHEILALEQRLSDIRLNIERYESQLNDIAGRVAYSTINVTLTDIATEELIAVNPTMGERIGGAFGDSVDGAANVMQNLIVFMAGAIIPILFFVAIGFAAYRLLRRYLRKLKYRKI